MATSIDRALNALRVAKESQGDLPLPDAIAQEIDAAVREERATRDAEIGCFSTGSEKHAAIRLHHVLAGSMYLFEA
jgi:hypothetical protein